MKNKPLIIANWKMKLMPSSAIRLARLYIRLHGAYTKHTAPFTLALCPSSESIALVKDVIRHSALLLGAQNCFWGNTGAYTGEVSPTALRELGCSYCIVGHSERRQLLGETDSMAAKKISAILGVPGLTPVVCIGENAAQRKNSTYRSFLKAQLKGCITGAKPRTGQTIVIAYEPIWAIGAGRSIMPYTLAETYHLIRSVAAQILPKARIFVLYGGSVTAENINSFIQNDVSDGCLIGGASVDKTEFVAIHRALAHI